MGSTDMRPMLAADASPEDLEAVLKEKVPLVASCKIDGLRCIVKDGVAMTRSLKPIPNQYVRECLSRPEYNGFDGELVSGAPNAPDVFNTSQSAFMSQGGRPQFEFLVFDDFIAAGSFKDRFASAYKRTSAILSGIRLWDHRIITDMETLLAYEAGALEAGYEGLILRREDSPYKFGRSTLKQGYLLKLKRFSDSEARIVGFEELMHNHNAAVIDKLGLQKRSSHKENLVGGNTMGVMQVEDIKHGWRFGIGTGFDSTQRKAFWNSREELMGKVVTYKYLAHGMKDVPRHPVFKGFRHD